MLGNWMSGCWRDVEKDDEDMRGEKNGGLPKGIYLQSEERVWASDRLNRDKVK